MNFTDKIFELKKCLEDTLIPRINSDYALLGLPYYTNIGDTLIWEGTISMLSNTPYRCLQHSSKETFHNEKLSNNVLILLQGGGNFGDIWRTEQDFRLKIIKEFPDNKIIILPQTIYYQNEATLRLDAELMSMHKNLTICARDNCSFNLLKKYFNRNETLLLPDMAFCIPKSILEKYRSFETEKTLFLKRTDKELLDNDFINYIQRLSYLDIHDWPTMEHSNFIITNLFRMIGHRIIPRNVVDWYATVIFRPYLIRSGIKFVSSYKSIYTTRLHVAILSSLLNKPFNFIDNSYGKNRSFFETWLSDLEGVNFID